MKTLTFILSLAIVSAPAVFAGPAASTRTSKATPTKSTTASGLVPLAAVKALPTAGSKRAVRGYPGSDLRVGAVKTAQQWKAVVAKSKGRLSALKVDWKRQMVVYAVFTGQTNRLSYKGWRAPKRGHAALYIGWSGIEPYYVNSTPGVFRVVNRRGVKRVTVRVVSGYNRGQAYSFRVR